MRAENEVFSTKSCFIAVADRDLASPTKPDFGLGRSFYEALVQIFMLVVDVLTLAVMTIALFKKN